MTDQEQPAQVLCKQCNAPIPAGTQCPFCGYKNADEEEPTMLLVVEVKAKEIEVAEELEIGDYVNLSVRGSVTEIRNSRFWDRDEEEERPKRKYMIDGSIAEVITKEHSIVVTPEAKEELEDGEI